MYVLYSLVFCTGKRKKKKFLGYIQPQVIEWYMYWLLQNSISDSLLTAKYLYCILRII